MSTIHNINGDLAAATSPLALADQIPIFSASLGQTRRFNAVQAFGGAIGTPTSDATAGAVTYTIAQLLTGIIVRDPAGASRTDVLPTAALIVAGLTAPYVGQVIRCKLINGADAAETVSVNAGSGGAYDTNQVAASRLVPQNSAREIIIRLTNVTAAAEAYVVYLA